MTRYTQDVTSALTDLAQESSPRNHQLHITDCGDCRYRRPFHKAKLSGKYHRLKSKQWKTIQSGITASAVQHITKILAQQRCFANLT